MKSEIKFVHALNIFMVTVFSFLSQNIRRDYLTKLYAYPRRSNINQLKRFLKNGSELKIISQILKGSLKNIAD